MMESEGILYPDEGNSVIQEFIREKVKDPEAFKSGISSRDEMYLYALNNAKGDRAEAGLRYYRNGSRIMDVVREIIVRYRGGCDRLESFLDFACGYGRLTRFGIQEMPPAKIWVSDIDAAAVKFQIGQFGVNGIVSTTNPQDYHPTDRFDVILASSFFSHVPEKTFASWLQKLYSLLSDRGLLIFSVHDWTLFPGKMAGGIHFIPQSESQSLDGQEYGTTYVRESFVRKAIQQVTGGEVSYQRRPKGLCGHQDLYIIGKGSDGLGSAMESKVLAIAGMHRSGTSLTASLLGSAGVYLGDRLVGVDVGNDKGHFEDVDFVEFHKQVLRSQSLDADGLTFQTQMPVADRYVKIAQDLISEKGVHSLWGWKDPRMTLFLDFWLQLLPDGIFLLVYRSPWEVVDSLYRRGTDEAIAAYPEKAVELWMHYNQKILEFYDRVPDRCLLANLSKIVSNPQLLIQTINEKFQINLTEARDDIIAPELLGQSVGQTHRPVLIKKYWTAALDLYLALDAKAGPMQGEPSWSWSQYVKSYSPQEWGFRDWWEIGSLKSQVKLLQKTAGDRSKLQQTQAELQEMRSQLQATQSQYQQLQTEAQELKLELEETGRQLSETRSQLDQTQGKLLACEGEISAMETSKFWRLRKRWFKVKRWMGLTTEGE
ncbi:MAG: methyltransferase [Hormoscilla sp.]